MVEIPFKNVFTYFCRYFHAGFYLKKPLLFLSACALQCNVCYFDTQLNQNACNTTVKNCPKDSTFCMTQSDRRPDGSRTFTRDCVPPMVCRKDYCNEEIINRIGRTDCNITCCQENFCNRDGATTVGSKGHMTHTNCMLEYFLIIVGIWFSLLGRQLQL